MKRTPDWQGWHILNITLVLLAVLGHSLSIEYCRVVSFSA
jgi:hypothetical protein